MSDVATAPASEAKKGIPGWAKAIIAIAILATVLFAAPNTENAEAPGSRGAKTAAYPCGT